MFQVPLPFTGDNYNEVTEPRMYRKPGMCLFPGRTQIFAVTPEATLRLRMWHTSLRLTLRLTTFGQHCMIYGGQAHQLCWRQSGWMFFRLFDFFLFNLILKNWLTRLEKIPIHAMICIRPYWRILTIKMIDHGIKVWADAFKWQIFYWHDCSVVISLADICIMSTAEPQFILTSVLICLQRSCPPGHM